MEQLFKNGDIGEEEFKKSLVGEKQRQFITSYKLQGEFDQWVKKEVERCVRETLEWKLGELTTCANDNLDLQADATNSASIRELQATQTELNDTCEALNYFQDILLHKSEDVVQFYAPKNFLSSDRSFLEYHGFHWPIQVSSASFYLFATMLAPFSL